MTKQRRIGNALLAGSVCAVLDSLIVYFIPGLGIPSFTGDLAPDFIIFLLGGLFLWFVLWYWVFMVRDRLRKATRPKKEN